MYLYLTAANARIDVANARAENDNLATVMAARARTDLPLSGLDAFGPLMVEEEQWGEVVRGTERWTGGADLAAGTRTVSSAVAVPGGYVRVVSSVDPTVESATTIVLLSLGQILLVLGALVVSANRTDRAVRRRVDVAVAAAERISAGELDARIGARGTDELARLGRAFDSMAGRLEAVDADQRRLLADLAHEIATPVHAVTGFARAVLDGTVPATTARAAIESNTARLSRLLDDLSRLRDLDSGSPGPAAPVDLGELCRRTVAEHLATATGRGVELTVGAVADDPVVHSHEDLVGTVLANLVTNGLRYTGAGGHVVLAVARDVVDGVPRLAVTVTDDGLGIAADQLPRVFDRFHRVDTARNRDSGGSGLGLAIARRAAVTAGAELSATSEPGEGSVFVLAFPQPALPEPALPEPALPDPALPHPALPDPAGGAAPGAGPAGSPGG